MVPFPEKKYKVILADPPWRYTDGNVPRGGVNAHYPTMSIEDIRSLPVKDIADNDALLFMWATFPQLQEALEVIRDWGFMYKTLGFSWTKINKDGTPFLGVGHYTRSNCEVCLIGVKGKASSLIRNHGVPSAVLKRRSKHSRKPDVVRDRIVDLVGDIPRIELFATQVVAGWDAWGLEIDGGVYVG